MKNYNNTLLKENLKALNKAKPLNVNLYDLLRKQLKYDCEGKCVNAFKVLSDSSTLLMAYNSIKSNPGNMTPGSDNVTLDGLYQGWIDKMQKALRSESYTPKPARRVYIPKPNGKKRPLGIASPRDKIIQQSLKLILEYILEPKFSTLSHGFRPNRGCHSALREIRSWKGVPWLIEGDIKGFFDNIDHHILESLLKNHFNDTRLFNLYWKLVKAGYMEWDSSKIKFVASDVGVPQGSIVSPVLSNLILHELDKYVEDLIEKYKNDSKGEPAYKTNPKYNNLVNVNYRLKKKIDVLKGKGENFDALRDKFVGNIKIRNRLKSTIPNPNHTKIRYVRYADDWILGVWGPHSMAKNIKHLIGEWLVKLKLELSYEKTKITNTRTKRAKFLGTYITRVASTHDIRKTQNQQGRSRRIPGGIIWMTAPITEIINKLESKGFLKKRDNFWKFLRIPQFTVLPTRDIVLRFRSVYRGLLNYYSFADNKKQFLKIKWILGESLMKTLMSKLDKSKKEIINKFGRKLTVSYKGPKDIDRTIDFHWPDLTRTPMFFASPKPSDPLKALGYKISTRNPFDQPCANCGATTNIEMHHIKHIRTINPKLSEFDKMVAAINRKQVPLCRTCHVRIHTGKYHGKKVSKGLGPQYVYHKNRSEALVGLQS